MAAQPVAPVGATIWGDESRRHRGHRQGGRAARRVAAALAFALQGADGRRPSSCWTRATLVIDTGGLGAGSSPVDLGPRCRGAALAEVAAARAMPSFAAAAGERAAGLRHPRRMGASSAS